MAEEFTDNNAADNKPASVLQLEEVLESIPE